MAMARILVIDDDQVYAETVCGYLELKGHVAFAGHTAKAGLALVRSVQPDLVLLDIRLPDMDGMDACEQIQRITNAPIVYLTVVDGDVNVSRGLQSGDDYCVKASTSLAVLAAKVEAKLRRVRAARATVTSYDDGGLYVDWPGQRVERGGLRVELSTLEGRLLFCLVERIGQVVSRSELLDVVWGESGDRKPHNLATLVSRVRRKIEPEPSDPRYILSHRGVGYSFEDHRAGDGLLGLDAITDAEGSLDTR